MQWRASARKAALIGVGYAGGRLLWDASTKKFGGDINTFLRWWAGFSSKQLRAWQASFA